MNPYESFVGDLNGSIAGTAKFNNVIIGLNRLTLRQQPGCTPTLPLTEEKTLPRGHGHAWSGPLLVYVPGRPALAGVVRSVSCNDHSLVEHEAAISDVPLPGVKTKKRSAIADTDPAAHSRVQRGPQVLNRDASQSGGLSLGAEPTRIFATLTMPLHTL